MDLRGQEKEAKTHRTEWCAATSKSLHEVWEEQKEDEDAREVRGPMVVGDGLPTTS